MATGMTPNQCSTCQKVGGICMCGGCKAFFCLKHFNEHRQQLSVQFDCDVLRDHDNLLEQINKAKQSNASSNDLYSQIDRWETATSDKVKKAAERARYQLTQLLNCQRETLTEQFGNLTKEVRSRREEDDFTEDDVERLQQKINQLQQSLGQLTQPDKAKVIVAKNDQID